jgi:hypothetical protein
MMAAVRTWWPVLFCLAACSPISDVPDQETTITLSASPASASVGTPITFHFDAKGNSLEGVALEYGDGAEESIATYRARTASGNYNHGYTEAGEFRVLVTVLETGGLIASDSVTVTVTPATGSSAVLTSRLSRVN